MAYVTKANFANILQKIDFYKWKRPLIEDNLNRDLIFDDWQRENSKQILEEISSVALRSPACYLVYFLISQFVTCNILCHENHMERYLLLYFHITFL
jgi:hypothetical protein